MPDPNCVVALTFFADTSHFSYYCTSSSRGWQVLPDGSIHPPSRARKIRLDANGYPYDVVFVGCQIVLNPQSFPAESTAWYVEPGLNVQTEPAFLPTTEETPTLTLTFPETSSTPVFYRLAVRQADDANATVHWDDPKIYRDPDE
jgi:hypothetical protein